MDFSDLKFAFLIKGFNIKWKGKGVNEIGHDENTGKELIFVSDKYHCHWCQSPELFMLPYNDLTNFIITFVRNPNYYKRWQSILQ